MNLVFSTLFFLGLLSTGANALVIKSSARFEVTGSFKSFSWAPERYGSKFRYDIFYYIPKKIENDKKAKALIYLHGGGPATTTRADCWKMIQSNSVSLIRLADQLGVVLIMPSSNGLQWSGHTRGMLRDLAQIMRSDLDIDSDFIGVAGHSMGGMGITRNYQYGADEFAFFMPSASGIDTTKPSFWNDEYLQKVFNIPYVQLQGKRDEYTVFVERNLQHEARIRKMEKTYGEKSKFQVIFYDGDHGFNPMLFKKTLESLFQTPRDLYQKNLYGTLYTANFSRTEEKITYNQDSEPRYFWVELKDSDLSKDEVTHFTAKIDQQDIRITIPKLPKMSKTLRVYLSQRMQDLSQEVRVWINDEMVKVLPPITAKEENLDPKDPAFLFNGFVDIKIPVI